ncbi:MAG: transporter [Rhizobiaceae bacterium]|nr:transporter [Rhizobiaceae bacterium]
MSETGYVRNALYGAVRMMFGKPDGLKHMDLSVDGFWNSFAAIPLAFPPLLLSWLASASDYISTSGNGWSRSYVTLANGVIELSAWIVPLMLLALAARTIGIADRFIAYVVSTNWASVVIAWFMLPVSLLRLFAPDFDKSMEPLWQIVYIVTLVLIWRLTNAAIGKGAALATGVFVAMFVVTILTVVMLVQLFGL